MRKAKPSLKRTAQLHAALFGRRKPAPASEAVRIVAEWESLRALADRFSALHRLDSNLRKRGLKSHAYRDAAGAMLSEDEDGQVTVWQDYSERFDAASARLADAARLAMLKGNYDWFAEVGRQLKRCERERRRLSASERDNWPDELEVAMLKAACEGPVNVHRLVTACFGSEKQCDRFESHIRQAFRIARRYRIKTADPGRPSKKG